MEISATMEEANLTPIEMTDTDWFKKIWSLRLNNIVNSTTFLLKDVKASWR